LKDHLKGAIIKAPTRVIDIVGARNKAGNKIIYARPFGAKGEQRRWYCVRNGHEIISRFRNL